MGLEKHGITVPAVAFLLISRQPLCRLRFYLLEGLGFTSSRRPLGLGRPAPSLPREVPRQRGGKGWPWGPVGTAWRGPLEVSYFI